MRYRSLVFFALMTACGGAQFLPEKKLKGLSEEEGTQTETVSSKACLNLVNGVETNEMEAVVLVETATGYCTGTFVSDNSLITAAHCANATKSGGLRYRKVEPLEVIHYGKVSGSKSAVWEDLMVVIFPRGTSKSFTSLNARKPEVGNRLTLIGYGQTDLINDNRPDGKKRKGSNAIKSIQENNTVITYEAPKSYDGIPLGESSMTARGDSGGPLFAEGGGLVGIVSRGSIDPNLVEYDVNLFSTESLKLMEAALTRGATINGIENVRASIDPKNTLKGSTPGPSTALAGRSSDATSCR